MVPGDWIEHRRARDRELVGWIRPEGDAWVAMSVVGHAVSEAVEWSVAEQVLDELGLTWLADVWTLDTADGPKRVRIVQVAPDGIVVETDNFGAIDVPTDRFDLPWPAPPSLRRD